MAQYPLGLLDDAFFIHDEEQWPHAFSCEQLFLPTATSVQAPLLLLLGEDPWLEGLLGEEPLLKGLLVFGEDGVGPS